MAGIGLAGMCPYPYAALVPIAALRVSICACLCVFVVCRNTPVRICCMLACGILALTAQRADELESFEHVRGTLDRSGFHYLDGRVVSTPLPNGRGCVYEVRCASLCGVAGKGVLHTRTLRGVGWEPPEYGRRVLLRGQYRAPRVDATPGAFDEYRYLLSRGLWGTFLVDGCLQRPAQPPPSMRVCAAARRPVYATLAHVKDPGNRAVLRAALLGERAVPSELKTRFRDAGISHLLAISGLHVGILTAALLCAFSLVPLSRRLVYPIIILILWGYVAVVGTAPSLVRAAIMATLILGSFTFQRTSRTLNALGIAGILWLLFSPASAFTPGYQLSFAATFGIVAGMRFCQKLVRDTPVSEHPVLRHLYNTASVSVTAFLSTLPAVTYHFAAVSLFGLIANLVVVTLMTGCMWLFFAAIVLQTIWPFPAAIAMHGSSSLLSAIVGIAGLSRYLPPLEGVRPPMPLCACYAAFLVGVVTVRRRSLPAYLSLVTPLALIVAGAWLLVVDHTRPLQFWWRPYDNATVHVIGFPTGEAWLIAADSLDERARRDVRSFLSTRRLRLTRSIHPRSASGPDGCTLWVRPEAPSRRPPSDWVSARCDSIAAPAGCTLRASPSAPCAVSVTIDGVSVAALAPDAPPRFDTAVQPSPMAIPAAGFAVFRQAAHRVEPHAPYAHHPLASEAGDCPLSGG